MAETLKRTIPKRCLVPCTLRRTGTVRHLQRLLYAFSVHPEKTQGEI